MGFTGHGVPGASFLLSYDENKLVSSIFNKYRFLSHLKFYKSPFPGYHRFREAFIYTVLSIMAKKRPKLEEK